MSSQLSVLCCLCGTEHSELPNLKNWIYCVASGLWCSRYCLRRFSLVMERHLQISFNFEE